MARLFSCGFEAADKLCDGLTWRGGFAQDHYVTIGQRSGDRAIEFSATSILYVENRTGNNARFSIPGGTSGYYRFYYKKNGHSVGASGLAIARIFDAANVMIATVRLIEDGTIALEDAAGGQIAASASALSNGEWHRIEVRLLKATTPTTSNGTWEFRADGTTIGSGTTANLGTGTSAQAYLRLGKLDDLQGNTHSFDDVAVNDSTGTAQNSWAGEGSIISLVLTGDYARAGFTDADGLTTNLYQAVDNEPPLGVPPLTSTGKVQIESSAVKNTTDNFEVALQTYTDAGLAADATVSLVQDVYVNAPNSDNARLFGMTKTNNPASAETTASTIASSPGTIGGSSGGWTHMFGSVAYAPAVTLGAAPRIRVRKAANVAEIAACCYMALMVEYVPGAPALDPRPRGIRTARPADRRQPMRTRRALIG